ncbi:hypothetical protein [Kitasatospora purpeofusca]|uniref:hypothetical protein n=1 Tax=Kitasatospora purpeofusca TaxID=67352 RepID=UPI00386DF570|nr:hypothetical protein OIP63_01720 [Kitasatospora purpeofusca]
MQRVLRRSVTRALTRRELWNGNRESFRHWLDPDHPIRWAWARHSAHRRRTLDRLAAHPGLTVVHLTSARAARAWLRTGGRTVVPRAEAVGRGRGAVSRGRGAVSRGAR